MIRLNPVTVAGRGFKPHRRVNVHLLMGQTLSRTPLANRAGAFTVQFPDRDRSLQRLHGDGEPAEPSDGHPALPGQAGVRAGRDPIARYRRTEWLIVGRPAPRK